MLTEEQKSMRLTGIGGSEIAAVAGLNPYASPIDVFRSKVEGVVFEGNERTRRGQILEPAVAEWYREETGAQLREVGTIRHPVHSIALATPDRIARHGDIERVLEIKTANIRQLEQWGEGDDEVPVHHLAQVQWTMACVGLSSADLAVLLAGDTFRLYHLVLDTELVGMLMERAEQFWRDYVVTKTPPPLDGSDSSSRWLAERFPKSTAQVLQADEEAEMIARGLRAARLAEKDAKERATELTNLLKARLGDAEAMTGEGWRISWKNTKGKLSTDWKAIVEELNAPEDIIQKYTRISAGSRRFLPTFRGLSDE